MSKNSIGVPVLVVKVENISEKVIDGYEIAIAPLNRFGESIERFETGDRSIKGVSNSIIEPKITANSNPKAAPVYCGSTKEECGGYSNVICSVTSAGRSCRGIPPERVYCGDFEWDSKCPEYSNVSCNVGGTPRCTGIPPLKVYFQSITLHGYNTATNAELKLIRVHFQDETSWRNPDIIDPLSEIAIDTN